MSLTEKHFHPSAPPAVLPHLAGVVLPEKRKLEDPPNRNCPTRDRGGLPLPRPPTIVPAVALLLGARCKMKGCVFPASELAMGLCHFHEREAQEPEFFQSFQPILLVLEKAKYGVASEEYFEDRRWLWRRLLSHRATLPQGVA